MLELLLLPPLLLLVMLIALLPFGLMILLTVAARVLRSFRKLAAPTAALAAPVLAAGLQLVFCLLAAGSPVAYTLPPHGALPGQRAPPAHRVRRAVASPHALYMYHVA